MASTSIDLPPGEKCMFGRCCVTLTYEPITLKMSLMSSVYTWWRVAITSFIKIISMHYGDRCEMPPPKKCLLTICGLAVTLTFDLFTSESNQFIFVPNCIEVTHLAKFLWAVYKLSCSQNWSLTHAYTDSSKQHASGTVLKLIEA